MPAVALAPQAVAQAALSTLVTVLSAPNRSGDPAPLVPAPTVPTPVDLLSDLPPFEQRSSDIQAVVRAIGNELARVDAARNDLVASYFPGSAGTLLRFFEQLLGLPNQSQITLAQRQATVQSYMRLLKNGGAGTAWEAAISSLVGPSWSYKEHIANDASTPAAHNVLVRFAFSTTAAVPAGLAVVRSGAGSLAAGTYYYAVTATTPYGETLPSAVQSLTVTAGSAVNVTWTPNTSAATGYNVYRGASAATLQKIGSATTSPFADAGAATPGAIPPSRDTSGSVSGILALQLTRAATPAHIALQVGYTAGFLVGISNVGVDAL